MSLKSWSEIKLDILRNPSLENIDYVLGYVRRQVSQDLYNKYVVDLATDLKESQQYTLAITLLEKNKQPKSLSYYHQLSICYSTLEHHDKAVRLSQQAINCLPFETMTSDCYSKELVEEFCVYHTALLAGMGLLDKAHFFYDYIVRKSHVDLRTQIMMQEIIAFFGDFPSSRILDVFSFLIDSSHVHAIDHFYDYLDSAICKETPFSMIRLDDGEGANLPWDSKSYSRFGSIIQRNRDIFLGHWFGSNNIRTVLGLQWLDMQSKLATSIEDANFLGLNMISRMKHELSINSLRGILSIFNTYRWCFGGKPISSIEFANNSWLSAARPRNLVTAQIHYEIGLSSKRFFSIICKARKVVLISCREKTASLLSKKLGKPDFVTWIEIPSEKLKVQSNSSSQGTLGEINTQLINSFSSDERAKSFTKMTCPQGFPHYPDRYYDVCKIIHNLAQPGVVFLIAAGVLAKIYAHEAKKSGAIALDIGSLADIYAGVNSRDFARHFGDLQTRIHATISQGD